MTVSLMRCASESPSSEKRGSGFPARSDAMRRDALHRKKPSSEISKTVITYGFIERSLSRKTRQFSRARVSYRRVGLRVQLWGHATQSCKKAPLSTPSSSWGRPLASDDVRSLRQLCVEKRAKLH